MGMSVRHCEEAEPTWQSRKIKKCMVGVAQLVELSVVVRAVAGSNPVAHPIFLHAKGKVSPSGEYPP